MGECHGIDLSQAETPTPAPSDYWLALGGMLQRQACLGSLHGCGCTNIDVVRTTKQGEVILRLLRPMPAADRGRLLRMAEAALKDAIDPALVVYLEAVQDRNAVRRFRGVEVGT